ncbi:MAG TPA: hypothetical protein VEK85_14135 [Gemmatimonadales bacterium]|nr:hypothetical protein [Gemmatimonadales bacterium]
MENNRQCARLALVTAFCLGAAACQLDSPTGSPVVAEPVLRIAERAADGLDASGNCTGCVVGPVTFVRDPGAPRSETLTFSAVAGTMYMVDLDDLGSRGADASVMLNDDTLLTPRGTGNASTQHFSDSVRLTDRNTLVVRLVGKPGSKLRVAIWTETPFVITGIRDIRTFLERCPTNDAAYVQIRRDFELRADGQVVTADIPCSEPYSLLPIDQLTDELVTLQVLRTAYYMSQGTEGKLPWTQKALYVWMSSNVAGVNLKTSPGQLYCCDVIEGKLYVATSRQDAGQREFKRTWPGLAGTLAFYAHEIRHADAGAPAHTTGCPEFPLPTGPLGCDLTYDLNNLSAYGVQYWLQSSWATGYLNIGIGCSPPSTALEYAQANAQEANAYITRFVSNPPPLVTPTPPYGGPCLASLSTRN